ncbi:hypothetical protein Nepgr_012605 [Nepenthes gracilis]|uniref:Uncharacterized protein n=1 Tax=Nepenthes gracilis TaxID=150966 RepID=A0AAD3SHI3_NEPGR|nr:hypothetical protein Nepgr_012605 [Nepenthes gracilis]
MASVAWGSVAPVDFIDGELIHTLSSMAKELVESFSNNILQFQVKNSKSLVRKVEIIVHNSVNCGCSVKYCQTISRHFHDLNKDVRKQIELVQRQLRWVKLYVDKQDEMLRQSNLAISASLGSSC